MKYIFTGNYEKYRLENSWRDLVLFYEYFDSETGRGCGARWDSVYIQKLLVDALNMHCIPGNSFPNLKFAPFAQITMSGRIQDRVKLSACIWEREKKNHGAKITLHTVSLCLIRWLLYEFSSYFGQDWIKS